MVIYCRMVGCHNRADRMKNKSFYRLPEIIKTQGEKTLKLSMERRKQWLLKLNQDFNGKNLKNIRVCSDHFITRKKADLYDQDNPDWVPSVNTGKKQKNNLLASERYNRRNRRSSAKSEAAKTLLLLRDAKKITFSQDAANQHTAYQDTTNQNTGSELSANQHTANESTTNQHRATTLTAKDASVQTHMDCTLIAGMEMELEALRTENAALKERVKVLSILSQKSFKVVLRKGTLDKQNETLGSK